MKDIKDFIKVADVYGIETRKLQEKREKELEEGMWDDLVGKIADVAKNLGIDPATADSIAAKISTQPDLEKAAEQGKPPEGADGPDPSATPGADAAAFKGIADAGDAGAASTKDLMTRYNEGGKKAMPEIEKLQKDLQAAGFDPNGIDGKYGNGTFKAVQAFQKSKGIQADGQAGPETLKALAGGGAASAAAASPEVEKTDIARITELVNKALAAAPSATAGVDGAADAQLANRTFEASDFRNIISIIDGILVEALSPEETKELQGLIAKYPKGFSDPAAKGLIDKAQNAINAAAAGADDADSADSGAAKAGIDGPADAAAAAASQQNAKAGIDGAADAAAGATDAEKAAGAGAPQTSAELDADSAAAATPPKVGKEVYVQMGANGPSTANFNVSKMKAKYPKPYVDIPAKDGTVTRGYGDPKTLQAYVAKNKNAKIVGAGGGATVTEASMNISMNGADAREVAELVGILKNAGMDSTHIDMPTDIDPYKMGPEPCSTCGGDHGDSPCSMEEDWDNSPEESYADHNTMTKDLSGGINRQKKAYAAAQDGDNAMAVENSIKEQLWAALNEKMTAEGSRGKKKKSRGAMEGSRGKTSRGKKSRG